MIDQEIAIKDTGVTIIEEGVKGREPHVSIEEMATDSFNIDSIVDDIMGESPKKKESKVLNDPLEEMATEDFGSFKPLDLTDKIKEEKKAEEPKKEEVNDDKKIDTEEDIKKEEFNIDKAKLEIEKELGELGGNKENNEVELKTVDNKVEENNNEEPKKKVGELNTDDLIKKLEAEINKDLEENAKVQEEVKQVQEKIEKGEDYGSLVTEFNELVDELDNKDIELNKTKDLLLKYKTQLQTLGGQLNQKEIDFGRNEPILNTVNTDRDLKGMVLAYSKADQDPKYKDVALDYVYSWLQKQTGVDIKSIMSQENESSKDGMSGNTNSSSNSFKAVGGKKTTEDNIIQGALRGVTEF